MIVIYVIAIIVLIAGACSGLLDSWQNRRPR